MIVTCEPDTVTGFVVARTGAVLSGPSEELFVTAALENETGVLNYDSGTRKLVFNGPHVIPGNGSKTFKYSVQFPATASSTYLNTAIAYVGGTTIDANLVSASAAATMASTLSRVSSVDFLLIERAAASRVSASSLAAFARVIANES